uniref:Calcium voltage-gated channel auxiliary subunit alpha2delta 4 n=1 Tax=Oreochromis niloticus TaxID=8128 RepID=A0A669C1G4_ORENI
MKSVKRLAESAEDSDLYHEFNATLEFDYYNSMMINTADEDGNYVDLGGEFPLEENEHFNKLPVNTQMSNIQVPTNVYNKDPNILNAIYNTEALNDVFISNFQKDPTLTWQYFGSSTGFFRIYPGIKWTPDSNGVVAFDCRNRNWYIQAATSPKDIIIMVDISGSMKGLKMTIAKHTINTILDTLGENDFVNVIAYTDYVRYVEPCFRGTLVQADLDNREVRPLSASWIPKEANGQGSMCNQAIMLITDGAMEDFESVFEEFNWPERRVRVFTYLIGREMTFAQNTKWIACNNKGYYTHISTLADVQENVMEYLHVLSRPMVINHDHDIIWTEAYMDSVVSLPGQSKGLKKPLNIFTLSHGILLGVVGSDIPLMEVMKLAPRYMLGAHGYAFLINNNGYILAHPDLRPLYKDGKKLKPKPNYNSVDLSEVEWEDTDELLRTAMVKGETGTLSLNIRASVDKGKRPLYLTNEYFYTNIDDTPFSFGMALTKGHGKLMFMGNVSVEEGEVSHNYPQSVFLRTYCETDIDPAHRKYSQLQAAIRYLLGKEPDLECDEVLLSQTLFDAVVTAPLEAYWNTLMLNDRVEPGVETAFLGTRSGLMRVVRYAGVETRVFLTPADKDNLFTIDHFPLWYRLAVENSPGKFYYYPVNDKGFPSYPASVLMLRVSLCFLFLAVGLQMSLDWLEKRFWAIAKQVTAGLTFTQTHILCKSTPHCKLFFIFMLLNSNNKSLLASCCLSQIGRFFGEVDGSIMASLLKMGMFKKVSLFDYQAMCKTGHHHASSARPLLSPKLAITHVSKTHLWTSSAHHKKGLAISGVATLCNVCVCVCVCVCVVSSAHKQKKVDALQPCDTAYPGFMYDPSVREANSLIKCGRFVDIELPVFLNICEHNATVKCNRMKSQKVRRRPESCHAYHPKENAKDCGGAAAISLSLSLFSASLLVSLVTEY